ncbi:MAG: hypothetical protein ACRC2G_14510 [Aestuariivirga sp.]
MPQSESRKLPPMSALEFAIHRSFSNFLFGLRLLLGWLILQLPLLAALHYGVFQGVMPDPSAPTPRLYAAAAALGLFNLIASISFSVNWHRRLLLSESPRGLGWFRLDGVVWRYLFRFVIIGIIVALIAGVATAVMQTLAAGELLGPAGRSVGIAVAVILGLFALFAWYRLSSALPAVAVDNKEYGLAAAWRATRRNSLRYLGFTFWLIFALAIGNGLSGGAFAAQEALKNPWLTAGAGVLAVFFSLLTIFVTSSIATSHFYFFGEGKDYPEV